MPLWGWGGFLRWGLENGQGREWYIGLRWLYKRRPGHFWGIEKSGGRCSGRVLFRCSRSNVRSDASFLEICHHNLTLCPLPTYHPEQHPNRQ